MSQRHAVPARGLDLLDVINPSKQADTVNFGARFGRMFADLPAATFGKTEGEVFKNLELLAAKMVASFDAPKDGPDDEESGIPSLYTYLGQFIDHDLTFDPDGSFQKQKDPNATEDFRTPAFDLDNIYGRGPGDQPYLYDEDGKHFLLGDPLMMGTAGARDLQRNGSGCALIGDPRNDENAIVSQLQGLFLRFHNRLVDEYPTLQFEEVQEIVRQHYQYLVMYDFLPRIVTASVLNKLKENGIYKADLLTIFKPAPVPFMPVEFSVAAYRLGHSMVRPGYRLNDAILLPIFPNPLGVNNQLFPPMPEGLVGFRRMVNDWGIDWARFIDLDPSLPYGKDPDDIEDDKNLDSDGRKKEKRPNFRRLQFAYRIDTSIVDPLGNLPKSVTGDQPPQKVPSLALRNLLRGVQFGLPSGEKVAEKLGVAPIDVTIGKGLKPPDPTQKPTSINDIKGTTEGIFDKNTPLWTYILAEAMAHQVEISIPVAGPPRKIWTPQLGPVGGRIVAEVFLGLAFSGRAPFNPAWKPVTPNYTLKDFVRFALGQ